MDLERAPELLPILKDNSEGPLSIVFDSLTDLALNDEPKGLHKFIQSAMKILDDPRITAVFLLNPSAHDPKDIASVRGAFTNQLGYGKEGVTIARFG